MKKIEDRQFVDFQDLHPENQAAEIVNSSDGAFITVDQDSGLLRQKDQSHKKVKVNSFHRWVVCWNIFAQAHLHFHPTDYHKLFCYFSRMVIRFGQYKFDACLRYDRECRLRIANQRNLNPARRTVCWTQTCDEIRIACLTGHELSSCAYCKAHGHIEATCRLKLDRETKGSLTQQIAAAIANRQPQYRPQPSTAMPRSSAFAATHQHASQVNSNSFRNTNQQQQQKPKHQVTPPAKPTPPGQRACRYFNRNIACLRNPCQFAHVCSFCGRSDHNLTTCDTVTSTHFTP